MKLLFLTSKLGYGHTRAADAIEAALSRRGSAAEIARLDLWDLMDARVAEAVKDGYLRMTRELPEFYQRLYELDENIWRQVSGEEPLDRPVAEFLREQQRRWFPERRDWFDSDGRALDRTLVNTVITRMTRDRRRPSRRIVLRSLLLLGRIQLVNRLEAAVADFDPDVIVATQMYPHALMGRLKQRGRFRDTPVVGTLTDFGVHGVWTSPPANHYCVASRELAAPLEARGVPHNRVHATGIPLMPPFEAPITQADARQRLELSSQRPTVLVTGGQYGIGVAEALAHLVEREPAFQVLVAAGRSREDLGATRRVAQRFPNRIRLCEWVEDMSVLLRAADVVTGKPGGLSVSEALACGRPFFANCSLGGQEGHNVTFLARHGVGGRLPPERLADRLQALLNQPAELARLQDRAWRLGQRHGARRIAGLIEQLTGAVEQPWRAAS